MTDEDGDFDYNRKEHLMDVSYTDEFIAQAKTEEEDTDYYAILLRLANGSYMYLWNGSYRFKSLDEMDHFVFIMSGEGDYVSASDLSGNVYLLSEKIYILAKDLPLSIRNGKKDVYDWFNSLKPNRIEKITNPLKDLYEIPIEKHSDGENNNEEPTMRNQ